MIRLTRLQPGVAIIKADLTGDPNFVTWWQEVCEQIEASVNGIIEAQEAAIAAQIAAEQAQQTADAAQPSSVALTGLADLPDDLGAVEQTSPDLFSIRAIGIGSVSSLLTRGNGDSRYVRQDIGPSWGAATGTTDRTSYAAYSAGVISNPPTQAEVQAVADELQSLSRHFVAMVSDLRANGALTN